MTWSHPPDMHIWYHAFSFPSNVLASGPLTFNVDDLAHALFATGRAPGDRAVHGNASVFEWLHRTSLVPAYLRRVQSGLVKSNLALGLDRSEKMALSYALGQAMTGVFCENQLLVAYLMHVDRYANQFGVQFGPTQRRPDLIGRAPSGWVVAEAKGRSGGMPNGLRETLENQKRSVIAINGTAPWLALGCVTHFPNPAGLMHLDAFDPDEPEIEAVAFEVSLDRFMLAYYLPFLRAIEVGDAVAEDSQLTIASFDQHGLRVGMPNTLAERIRRAEAGELAGLYEEVQNFLEGTLEGRSNMDARAFRDGVTIATTWDEALSLRDWGQPGETSTFG